MVERVRNVIKWDRKSTQQQPSLSQPNPKRSKKRTDLSKRYPVCAVSEALEDISSLEQHKKAISDELSKSNPRDSVYFLC